jgi:hypothetical protein
MSSCLQLPSQGQDCRLVTETVHSVDQLYLPTHALSPTDDGSKVPGDSGGSVKYNVSHYYYFDFRRLVYLKVGTLLSPMFILRLCCQCCLLCARIFSCNSVNSSRETSSIAGESQAKTLKNLIRNIGSGLPTSPMLGRKMSYQSSSGNAENIVLLQSV